MKRIIFFIAIVQNILLMLSCRKALKDVNDYFPKVKTIAATVQPDGSVLVEGEVESQGYSKIQNIGFCYSTKQEPTLADNQVAVCLGGHTFSVVYPSAGFSIDSVYYFRSWAANEKGYAYGNTISLNSIIATPVVPPCTFTMNKVRIASGNPIYTYYSVSVPERTFDNTWTFKAETPDGPTVYFEFGSEITTGIYNTTTSTSPGNKAVAIHFYQDFISGYLDVGNKVYVNTISPGVYDISICDATWTEANSGSKGTTFTSRVHVPL